MSRTAVGMAIEELLTNRQLRMGFAVDPVETVAALCLGGIELNPEEFNLFCQTDAYVWFVRDVETGELQH